MTHSDTTGDLFLTVAAKYNRKQIAGWYTRLMRDEVLAEWHKDAKGASLHVFCHVSGGLVFGSARLRYSIFQRELPLVLEAFRYGDARLYLAVPELDRAPIVVHFASTNRQYRRAENWGKPADYRIRTASA